MKLLQRWKQSTVANQTMIITSLLMAFATVFYAVAAGFQVLIMKQSAADSSAQVERLTKSTNDAIARSVQENSKSLSMVINKSQDTIKSILEQNRQALAASERQGAAALVATINASHVDQRAYVILDKIYFTPVSEIGQPPFKDPRFNFRLSAGI